MPGQYGSPEQALEASMDAMEAHGLRIVGRSSIWLSAPVPVSDQPWYRNAVVQTEATMRPFELLETLMHIEQQFGRVRTVRNAPRVLDLDLLVYGTEIVSTESLILPHPRMHQRAFVLRPLQEIAPDWVHPSLAMNIGALIELLPSEQKIAPLATSQSEGAA